MLTTILIILLVLILLGALPQAGFASGYGPSGIVTVLLVVLVILVLTGRL